MMFSLLWGLVWVDCISPFIKTTSGRIATVFIRWEDPDTHKVVEISKDYDTDQIISDFRETDPYFQRAVVVAEYAEILKGSYWAKESSIDDVYDEARRIADYLYRDDVMDEFVDLVREARRLKD